MTFEPGDIVALKSGGPRLTVSDMPAPEPTLVCIEWFSGTELKRDVVAKSSLIHEFGPSVSLRQVERIIEDRVRARA